MEIINKETWNRKDIFDMCSSVDYPFYSVTIPVDVTNVRTISRQKGLSFYYLLIWVCTKAINSVPEFRIRIRGEQVVRLDQTNPSFTNMKKGSDHFQIITMPWEDDYQSFCHNAKKKSEAQLQFMIPSEETDGLIFFSCTPWFDFTAYTNEHNFNKDDTVPRLAWGKYYEEQQRLFVHMAIEVNHRTIDGYHIGKFKEAVDKEISSLA